MEDIRAKAIIDGLTMQRNEALNKAVELWGEIVVLRAQIAELTEKNKVREEPNE